MQDLASRLGHVRHFRDLPPDALRAIVTAGQIRRFPAGSPIFLEGEPSAGMFVLFSGRVHLCKPGPHGQQQIIAVIEPVIMFNEVTVLDGAENPLMAMAVEDCITWCIQFKPFQELLACYPQVGLGLLPVLAARNRILISRSEDIAYRSVLARVAKVLLELSDSGHRAIDRRQHSMDEISQRAGSGRESACRALAALRDVGIVETTRSSIQIVRPHDLLVQANIQYMSERF